MDEQDRKTGVTVLMPGGIEDEHPTATDIRATTGILEVWDRKPGRPSDDKCLGLYSEWLGARNHGQPAAAATGDREAVR